ncbi:endonuclease/exonuclease/phosphatase family protein [Aureibaculum conchae]|uniref:endonuclease/exonuclease/phosphatase family protein n=1 Tax=Aureibaculum sp. 2308TA14-22 TaxID=3108392 RepID=UPI003395822A
MMRKLISNTISIILITSFMLNAGCKEIKTVSQSEKVNLKFTELKVMTWNIWGKLNLEPRYTINNKTARQRVIDILEDSEADIITMTETYGSAKAIADALKFNYYTPSPDANLTIFSRYPLENFGNIKGLSPFSFITATVNLPNNKKIKVYNIWLTSGGRHIVEIKNKKLSDEAFNKGDENRYEHIKQLLEHEDLKKDFLNKKEVPIIVAGDFNCVSHLDYTEETKAKKLNYNRIIPNKVSLAMTDVGFKDSYRIANPKITKETLGYTWTTVGLEYIYESGQGFVPIKTKIHPEPQYRNPFTRIDYIYYAGDMLETINSKTIIHHKSNIKRSFPEFPSDHGAVLTTFRLK